MAGVVEKVGEKREDGGDEPCCEESDGHGGKSDGGVDVEDGKGLGDEGWDGHGHYGGDER